MSTKYAKCVEGTVQKWSACLEVDICSAALHKERAIRAVAERGGPCAQHRATRRVLGGIGTVPPGGCQLRMQGVEPILASCSIKAFMATMQGTCTSALCGRRRG